MRSRAAVVLGLMMVAVPACTPDAKSNAWTVDLAPVVGTPAPRADSVRIDAYLDGTVSMGGYAVPGGEYGQFLEKLESTAQTGWKRTDIHYYKFGGTVREIERREFLSARSPEFYHEAGLSAVTSIEKATACRTGPNVTIIITDLFQSEGDVNAVVQQIKRQCFQQGITAGILGIPSRFDGTVYDAKVPSYRYASTADSASLRPFYALMFGEVATLERLVKSLTSLPFVDRRRFSTIGPTITASYTVTMGKPRTEKAINFRATPGPYRFAFNLRKGEAGGSVVDTIRLRLRDGAMPVRADQLELLALKKTPQRAKTGGWSDSTATDEFALTKVEPVGASLVATLRAEIPGASGAYAYSLALRAGAINGFDAPAWIRALSSDNPTPRADANKTLNLERFVLALRGAASSVTQPVVAKWYVDVTKQ